MEKAQQKLDFFDSLREAVFYRFPFAFSGIFLAIYFPLGYNIQIIKPS